MQMPLEITFRNLLRSPALEAAVRRRVEHIERFFGRVTRCTVTIEGPHRHASGEPFVVRIHLRVPGCEIDVSREHHPDAHADPYVAVSDAFDVARRQLQDYARRQRGDVKTHRTGATP